MKILTTSHPVIVWGTIVAAIVAGVGIYFAFYREAAPESDSREDLIKFVASDKFRSLSFPRRKYYIEKLREQGGNEQKFARRRHLSREEMQNLPEAERRKVMENLFRTERIVRDREALEFVKMSEAEKNAFLDRRIAEMEQFRRQREAEREARKKNANGNETAPPRPRMSQEERAIRHKESLESTPPEVRAARTELFRAMRERMKSQGKSFPRPPKR